MLRAEKHIDDINWMYKELEKEEDAKVIGVLTNHSRYLNKSLNFSIVDPSSAENEKDMDELINFNFQKNPVNKEIELKIKLSSNEKILTLFEIISLRNFLEKNLEIVDND